MTIKSLQLCIAIPRELVLLIHYLFITTEVAAYSAKQTNKIERL